jgi:prophage regulatory protein
MQVVHQTRPVVPRDRLVRLPEVEGITGCKKSTIYDLMRAGKFPRSVRLNARMVAWPETSILQWVQDRIADARNEAAQ